VLISGPPKRERQFQRERTKIAGGKKKKKTALYAWHGSRLQNWHGILANGLKNLSNTKYMSAGAAFGAGVYMAVNSATSMGYSQPAAGWTKSVFQRPRCLALCELLNHPELPKPKPHYVIKQEGWIVTRFLFIMDDNTAAPSLVAESMRSELPRLGQIYDDDGELQDSV
jgi:ubiquitin-conjugating enzyme E2 Q